MNWILYRYQKNMCNKGMLDILHKSTILFILNVIPKLISPLYV